MMSSQKITPIYPRLLADIGGTNARFALETAERQFEAVSVLACADYPGLPDAMKSYLASDAVRQVQIRHEARISHAAIAIANPIDGDSVRMTNHHWSFSISAVRAQLDFSSLLVINDFTALAMALPYLDASQLQKIGGGAEMPGGTIGLIGAGTGLGVSGIIPAGNSWAALSSEGGHASFAPANREEMRILETLWQQYEHVSAERLLSGKGLELICTAISGKTMDAADITRRALDGSCTDCLRTVEHFCAILGSMAGNVALTLGATGGMYIGGGIVPRLGRLFAASTFRQRFEAKGRLSSFLAQIPTYLITEEYPAFLGVSAMLADHLGKQEKI
ncbi:glucokinase [Undibacterium sp. Tian12W]|uniref:glucokinase n=1 Tax=Undibacterium sp. Tian12W TaxID=3413054 RepID=UPI003BF0C232